MLSNKPFLIWLLTTPPHLKYVAKFLVVQWHEVLAVCRFLWVVSRRPDRARPQRERPVDDTHVHQWWCCRSGLLGTDVPNRRHKIFTSVRRTATFSAKISRHCGLCVQVVSWRRRLETFLSWFYSMLASCNSCQCHNADCAWEESSVCWSVSVIVCCQLVSLFNVSFFVIDFLCRAICIYRQ